MSGGSPRDSKNERGGTTRESPDDARNQFRPEDHDNDHFILTTIVGSYPKPKWVDRSRELYEDPDADFDEDAWEEAQNDASRLITKEHERAGLDVVVDGEMRRNEMVEYFAHRISGYEFNGPVKVWGHNYFDKPSVVTDVEYDETWLVDEYEFTSEVADRPVKVPITGPYTLASWSFNEAYDDEESLAYDLADLVNEEIKKLVESGARYIQIDEPALATTPDDHAIVGECLERIADGISVSGANGGQSDESDAVPEDVYLGLHVCYGDYSRIYPEMLDYPVDEFDLELANGDYEQLDVFRDPEFTANLALGVTDAHTAEVESVEEIKENIKKGLEIVPPEQLTVSPDCGLKLLPREVAYGKMANMVQAAREVEAELDSGEIDVRNAPVSADD
ncbi:methionine synthase [Haladaptatus paucihalophilus DX253]|uniref:Methionine synthase n=1 Tax=Haladaptatus paucihalophilus DX253 TaxID=797209 RepID=E7QS74_HALPU|nr:MULTISPECIES: methionine synthase [Haladaptatus]EFW92843.1 methionine synthase [Haladaptatus paucihalophilus DX253]GKZ13562.1 methionine synthase [Haladaptatus sp. T7]SHK11159.1 methionine synthase (B12-independent) [Haladaptatus paucihalophilus DX253]